MAGQTVAYKRVSSVDQNTARQLDGLSFDEVFEDKCSGANRNRPALQSMLKHVRKGDTVVVHEISRLARDTADLLDLVKLLNSKGVTLKFVKENMVFTPDESHPMNQMLLAIIGSVAQFERAMINERRKEGQAVARAAGKHMGRKSSLTPDQIASIKERAANGDNKTHLANEYGISRTTLYGALKAA
jgi:DNA invertase Pin-like site-specific DNA recombinase